MAYVTDGLANWDAANDLARHRAWWCDETGAWTLFDTRSELRFNRCDPDGTARDRYASFSLLGLLKMWRERGFLALKWDLRQVAPLALAAAREHLASLRERELPVFLVFDYGGWHRHRCSSPQEALQAIERLVRFADAAPLLSLQVMQDDWQTAGKDRGGALAWGLSAWERGIGAGQGREISALRDHTIRFSPDARERGLLFKSIGDRSLYAATFDRQQRERLIGSPCDRGLPGQEEEDALLSRGYLPALEADHPTLQRIHCPLQARTGEVYWRSYSRLLLPRRGRGGEPELLSYCVESDSSFAFLHCA